MPGGSSATPGDAPKTEPPTSLLGAAGPAGSVALDVSSEVKGETPVTAHSAISVAEGARRREQYCVSVRVVTERDQKPLQAYAWNEGLLNDFFKATIGLPHSVIITSPTECVIFAPGRSNGLGMSFDDSIKYCHTLSGVHKWVGQAVQVTALQRTVKEGRYDISRAKEFTHERTKSRLAQLHNAAQTPVTSSPVSPPRRSQPSAMESPRGRGMTRRMDRHYVQETLRNMGNLALDAPRTRDEPLRQISTPEAGQYDSADQDPEEDDLAAELDFDSEESDTEATGNFGRSTVAERRRRRNRAMRRERARARRGYKRGGPPRRGNLVFSIFRGNDRDDCISYRDWRAEIESAMAKGYSLERIKLAMFEALEDMPKQHAYAIDSEADKMASPNEILENMDELYGVKMTFQALSAALCGLQQRPTESCRDYYDRMVQITVLLRERHSHRFCPGELTRMTKEYFYSGLRPEHRPIVAHLKDRPDASCMSLLIALQENEQNDAQTRTRYPPNTTPRMNGQPRPRQADRPVDHRVGGFNVRPVQMEQEDDGYTTQPVHLGAEPEEEYDHEDQYEDPDLNHWVDQGFYNGMVQAADSADVRFGRCFNCLEEGHRWRECTKLPLLPELQGNTRQRGFKPERGRWRQGSPRPPTEEGQWQARGPEAPRQESSIKQTAPQTPFRYWNQDALSRWLGPENLGWAQIDGRRTRVLLDTGARVNSVTPAYVRKHKLKVGSVSALDHSLNPFGKRVPLVGVGGRTRTLGYVLIRVQVEGVPGYDEEQVAFVVDDPTTTFGIRVPIVLGTPTINRVIAIMKESDLHNAPHEWQACRASHDAAEGFMVGRVSLDPGERFPTNTGGNPIDLDETVRLTTKCIVPGFQTVVVHGRTEQTMMIGEQRLHVLTQAPYPDDRAGLPNGVYITRTYTDLEPGSRRVAVVVRNMTSRPIHLAKGKVVARVQAANLVPEATPSPELWKKLGADSPAADKPQMTVKERQEALLAALKKDGGLDRLKDWPPALAAKAVRLLLEFHYIFSLEPNEIGCTDLTEHTIDLLKDEPFKERFRRIAPPVVEEVRAHIQEMLDGGAINPPSHRGVTPWSWSGRRMAPSASASTSVA